MSDTLALLGIIFAGLGVIFAILALVYVMYQGKNVEEQVKKRVQEELAPYREALEAVQAFIKRPTHEIMASMTRQIVPPMDLSQLNIVNEPVGKTIIHEPKEKSKRKQE